MKGVGSFTSTLGTIPTKKQRGRIVQSYALQLCLAKGKTPTQLGCLGQPFDKELLLRFTFTRVEQKIRRARGHGRAPSCRDKPITTHTFGIMREEWTFKHKYPPLESNC